MSAKIYTIACGKGGVAKTTTAISLASGFAAKEKPALLIDGDPQGQVSRGLGLQMEPSMWSWIVAGRPFTETIKPSGRNGLSLIPGDWQTAEAQTLLALRQAPLNYFTLALRPLHKSNLRGIFFDTSPSLGGLQERALFAADFVIIPTACTFLGVDAVASTYATIESNYNQGWKGEILGFLPTFYDAREKDSKESLEELRAIYGEGGWGHAIFEPIRARTVLKGCSANGQTIWEYAHDSDSWHDYGNLLNRVLETL